MKKNMFSQSIRILAQYTNPELIKPDYGRIIITSNCPLKCKMCTFWHNKHEDPSLDLVKHWIREMADFGIKEIALGGGEPFIRKDLEDIVQEIKSHGIICGVTTSGLLINEKSFPSFDVFEDMLDGYISTGIEGIEVYSSMHSMDDVSEFLRLADKKNMIISGGSDFHGDKGKEIGVYTEGKFIPAHILEDIQKYMEMKGN